MTESTGLRLLTDWTSIIKPLPAKLFPLTLLPSPLSFTPSDNFSAPLVSSHNSFCPHYDFERNIPFCHSIITLSSVGIMEQSLKQGVEGEVTPTGSYFFKAFSKNPSSASIPMYSRAVMPYPGSPGALFLEGSNIPDFLDSYSRMCTDYQVDEQEKIRGSLGIVSCLPASISKLLSTFWGLAELHCARFYARSTKIKT